MVPALKPSPIVALMIERRRAAEATRQGGAQ